MTAGDKKTDLNKAGAKAIKAIGKDDGTKVDPNAKFKVDFAQDAKEIKNAFTAEKLKKYRAVIFLDTAAGSLLTDPQKAAFESYFHAGGGFSAVSSFRSYRSCPDTRSPAPTTMASNAFMMAPF